MRSLPPEPVLPDLFEPDLAVIFCGTAAGRMSAAKGQYYAHPQNKFWSVLHATGLTPRKLDSSEFTTLPRYGIGLTDIAKYTWGMDHEVRDSLGPEAIEKLRRRIADVRPKILAFTSLTAGRSFCGAAARTGSQTQTIDSTRIWVLPSPSPAARRTWDVNIWHALADDVRKQRHGAGGCAP